MNKNKSIISKFGFIFAFSLPFGNAQMNIISDNGRPEILPQMMTGGESYKGVIDIGNKQYIKHTVESFASDLPIGLALPSIVPSNWIVDISDELKIYNVSWDKKGNWDDIIVEISKSHNLVVSFDWNKYELSIKPNDAEMLFFDNSDVHVADISLEVDATKGITKSPKDIVAKEFDDNIEVSKVKIDSNIVVTETDQDIADSLIACKGHDCSMQKVDIEKLVLDTDWEDKIQNTNVSEPITDIDYDAKDIEVEIARLEMEREQEILKNAKERDAKLRMDYDKATILHGDGSFEDFVNNGGILDSLDLDSEYVFVFKVGKLFDTINDWSGIAGFHVVNDIKNKHHIDYPIGQEIRIKGKYKDVVTLLLNKYKNAKIPVNHMYYSGGGANTLHIFESKFKSSYVK